MQWSHLHILVPKRLDVPVRAVKLFVMEAAWPHAHMCPPSRLGTAYYELSSAVPVSQQHTHTVAAAIDSPMRWRSDDIPNLPWRWRAGRRLDLLELSSLDVTVYRVDSVWP